MTAVAVGALVAAAVLAPSLLAALGASPVRRRLRDEPPVAQPVGAGRWRARRRRGEAPGFGRRARDAAAVVGAPLRRLARRPVDPVADAVAGGALVLWVCGTVVGGPVTGAALAAVALGGPPLRRRRRRTGHHHAVRAALPDTVDLFRLAVGAGLSVHQAVAVVAPRAQAPIGPALAEVRRRVALGVRLGDALGALDDLGDPARPLVAALTGAARYGSPLAQSLDRVAVDARLLRRRRAEERARRLPVQLLFPLVMCVLPAFGLLAVVPLLAGSLPSLGSP